MGWSQADRKHRNVHEAGGTAGAGARRGRGGDAACGVHSDIRHGGGRAGCRILRGTRRFADAAEGQGSAFIGALPEGNRRTVPRMPGAAARKDMQVHGPELGGTIGATAQGCAGCAGDRGPRIDRAEGGFGFGGAAERLRAGDRNRQGERREDPRRIIFLP